MRTAAALLLSSVALASAAPAAEATVPAGPSHCSAQGIRSTIVEFAAAFDRGDGAALDEVFADEPDFQWYSTVGRPVSAAKDRGTLLAYFAARHARGERLGLVRFHFNGNSPHYGNYEMTMRRRIPGVARGRWLRVPAKGAAVCHADTTRLIVVTFSRPEGRRLIRSRARS